MTYEYIYDAGTIRYLPPKPSERILLHALEDALYEYGCDPHWYGTGRIVSVPHRLTVCIFRQNDDTSSEGSCWYGLQVWGGDPLGNAIRLGDIHAAMRWLVPLLDSENEDGILSLAMKVAGNSYPSREHKIDLD